MDNGKLTVDNEVSSGMKFRYRNEDEMKDSGVEWIGCIPEEWKVGGLTKYLKSIIDYRGKTPEKVDEGIFLVTAKNIKNGKIDYILSTEYIRSDKYMDVMSRGIPKIGDVLFTTEAPLGEVANVDNINIALAQRVIKFDGLQSKLNNYFLKYFIMSDDFQQNLMTYATGSTALGIKASKLSKLQVILPNVKEQQKIANFLDEKITEFNSIISKKEALIQRLEEAKKSLISEVVTGKVKVVKTSDGYELVERKKEEMKDSGVEWFNKVPKDWKYSKLKYLTNQIIDGTHTTPNYIDSGIPFLRVTDITNNSEKIDKEKVKYISIEEHKELIKRCKPEKGDLLVSKNGTIGITKAIDWEWEFSIFVSLCLIKVKKELLSDLLSLFFKSNILDEQIAYGGKKTSITNLHLEKIREFVVPVPQLEEQQLIVNYLKRVCRNLNNNINKRLLEIEKLKEAKQSLISEAVTGKIEILD